MISTVTVMRRARRSGIMIPAFNIPYLPMMEPVIRALGASGSFGLIAVARLEWEKFSSGGLRAVYEEYLCRSEGCDNTRLHLDHTPVVDEDGRRVDYPAIIRQAIDIGFQSVMVDGSRLSLAENIAATRDVVDLAHMSGIPVEAELGAVLGHESGPLPPYEELYASGKGFTDPNEAALFARETGVDWLSVAVGNIHGAISGAARDVAKPQARLQIEHLKRIADATGIPLVLHGGSGIRKEYLRQAAAVGIAKINVGTNLRQVYEARRKESVSLAREAVYTETMRIIDEELGAAGSLTKLKEYPDGSEAGA